MVGDIGIGGNNPIRIQSMTTTDTMNTEATVAQAIRMIDAGCEIVRITAPSKKRLKTLPTLKRNLEKEVIILHWLPISILHQMLLKLLQKL